MHETCIKKDTFFHYTVHIQKVTEKLPDKSAKIIDKIREEYNYLNSWNAAGRDERGNYLFHEPVTAQIKDWSQIKIFE